MANIVKLNYTADEINEKLGKVDDIESVLGEVANETAVCIIGEGAPTNNIVAEHGALYMDLYTDDVYKCVGVTLIPEITISTTEGIANCYIQAGQGKTFSPASTSNLYNKYASTDFLDIKSLCGKTVKISCCMQDNIGFAIYDSNKTYISGENGKTISSSQRFYVDYEYTLPENAAYIRYSVHVDYNDISDGRVLFDETTTLCEWKAFLQQSDADSDPVFILPEKSIAVVGHEWNLYLDNIVDYMSDQYFIRCTLSPSIEGAKHLNDVMRFTPVESDIGQHELLLRLYKKAEGDTNVSVIKSATINIEVIADETISNKNALFIGDSLTYAGIYPAEIQYNLSQGGITSLGTRTATVTIGDDTYSVNHEGRSGWASYDYTRTREGYRTNTDNPFYNESTSAFDFGYYMEMQGYEGVDVVCIGLGTNGIDKKDDVCNAIDIMIASIHAYDPNIKIIISLITPPASQDGLGNSNGTQNAELLKMQELAMVKTYLARYQNTMPNVDVAELYFALDTKYDYNSEEQTVSARNPQKVIRQTGNVHPNEYGYLKFADVYYNNILYHLTNI